MDNTCLATVIDIDTLDISILQKLITAMSKLGIDRNQMLIEFSGSKGYHIWLIYEGYVKALDARKLGHVVVSESGVSDNIEVFPKQGVVSEGGYGNLMKLPFGVHRNSGKRSYLLDDGLKKTNWESSLERYGAISLTQLNQIIENFGHIAKENVRSEESLVSKTGSLPCVSKIMQGVNEGVRNTCGFKLALHLKNAGVPNVTAEAALLDWNERNNPPLSYKQVKTIVDSAYKEQYIGYFCEQNEIEQFCDSSCPLYKKRERTKDVSNKFSSPISLPDFMKKEYKDADGFWGSILDKKSKIVISGRGKIGKSFFAKNLGVAIATGKSFLNIPVRRPARVLYLQQEISEPNLQKRFKKVIEGYGGHIDEIGNLHCNTIGGFSLFTDLHFAQLKQWIKNGAYEIVIFDPLYKFHSAEENSATEMKRTFDKFDELIAEFEVSVIILHHVRKQYGETVHQLRGSSVIFDWGDAYIFLNHSKKGDGAIKIEFQLRNAEELPPLLIKRNDNCIYQVLGEIGKRKLEVADIVEAFKSFNQAEVSQKELLDRIVKGKVVKESTVRRRLQEAKKQGLMDSKGRASKHSQAIWSLR